MKRNAVQWVSRVLAPLLCFALLSSGALASEEAEALPEADAVLEEVEEPAVGEAPSAESGEPAEEPEEPAGDAEEPLPAPEEEPALDGAPVGLNVAGRTQAEIRQFAASHSILNGDVIYTAEPALTPPYAAGTLAQSSRTAALNAVNLIRYIAGLPANVTESASYTAAAQAAALVNAANNTLSHTPARPSGMGESLYNQGYAAAGSSNLGYGYSDLVEEVLLGWMSDSDSSNIQVIGHRRWILNPAMSSTGFGAVESTSGLWYAMYVFDQGSSAAAQSLVAWPAQNMPHSLFAGDDPWSLSVGSAVDAAKVKVTLTRGSDAKTWTFSAASSDGFFNVNNDGYGQPGCIIFRPSGIEAYAPGDVYTVRVEGVYANAIEYTVNFFDMDDLLFTEPTITLDAEELTINLNETNTGKVRYKVSGRTPNGWSLRINYLSFFAVSAEGSVLTVTGLEEGVGTLSVQLKDAKTDALLDSAECQVTVTREALAAEYGIDLSGIPKTGSVTGTGQVTVPSGQSKTGLYIRVTYVYTLASGESRAECRTVSVQSDGSFQLTNPATPAGATLDAIQAALVTDANSHLGGAYDPLKTANK